MRSAFAAALLLWACGTETVYVERGPSGRAPTTGSTCFSQSDCPNGLVCISNGVSSFCRAEVAGADVDASASKADASLVQDAGPDVVIADAGGTSVNPYGKAYPTKGIGISARVGKTPGSVLRNHLFTGHPGGDGSKGMQPISMANFYDPDVHQFKIVVLALDGRWCTYCRKETAQAIAAHDSLVEKKIGYMSIVVEGATAGVPAAQTDFDSWVGDFAHNHDVALDLGKAQLAPMVQAGGLPFNIVLDARSMEILYAGNGGPTDFSTAYDKYVTWVDTNPPTAY